MTTQEVEDVVRALATAVENLEASSARQSMLEAFMQVRAHAGEMCARGRDRSPRQRQVEARSVANERAFRADGISSVPLIYLGR
jgi:hypothetical protein